MKLGKQCSILATLFEIKCKKYRKEKVKCSRQQIIEIQKDKVI